MDVAQKFKVWNLQKWEAKNRKMYEVNAENKWPWFCEELDPDVEAYITGDGANEWDILDIGTCSGPQAIAIAQLGRRVIGTDVSKTALQQAETVRQQYPDLPIRFMLDDITTTRIKGNSFDLILDRGCYHSICCLQHREYVLNVKHLLRPGGTLLLKVMSSDEERYVTYERLGDTAYQMPFHFTEQEIHDVMSPHFSVVSVENSFFYSSVIDPPAKARLAILKNDL